MKRTYTLSLAAAIAMLLAACTTMPERIDELETARAIVPQVEASPRAGVAATYVAEARDSLDRANRLADEGGDLEDIKFEAAIATLNANIANEKILTVQARDEIEKGTAERQAVLIETRERAAQDARERASTLEQELAELKAKPSPRGLVLTLGDVLFDIDKASLKPGAYATLDRVAEVLRREPEQEVVIEGHTDSTGSDQYNQDLSARRAQAVQAALIERGVRADQIRTQGKGETFPVASNANAAGRQQNRRVEMIFADTGPQTASDE